MGELPGIPVVTSIRVTSGDTFSHGPACSKIYELKKYILVVVCVSEMCECRNACGGQRTTFTSQFSPSPMGSEDQTLAARLT